MGRDICFDDEVLLREKTQPFLSLISLGNSELNSGATFSEEISVCATRRHFISNGKRVTRKRTQNPIPSHWAQGGNELS